MRLLTVPCTAASVLVLISVGVLGASSASADWYVDWDGPSPDVPPTWTVPTSATYREEIVPIDADHGYFHAWDTRPPSQGGTFNAGTSRDEVFTDVRVAATINPAGNTDGFIGLYARANPDQYGTSYFSALNFSTGRLNVAKATAPYEYRILGTVGPVTDLARAYYLELDVVGDTTPTVTARLFDQQGGDLLLSVVGIDDGIAEPVFLSGTAGTSVGSEEPTNALDVSVDDLSAISIIPEPSTLALLAMSAVGLLGYALRRRRR